MGSFSPYLIVGVYMCVCVSSFQASFDPFWPKKCFLPKTPLNFSNINKRGDRNKRSWLFKKSKINKRPPPRLLGTEE